MGGKSGKGISGYRYKHLFFDVWADSVDTLHRFVAGGKRAWEGCIHTNQTLQINAPKLWGDDEDNGEGGLVGPLDVQFGGPDQPPNPRLASLVGPNQTGNRGFFSTVFAGIYGSFVPNPKDRSALIEHIHAGWPGGLAWYPEKAAIPIVGGGGEVGGQIGPTSTGWRYLVTAVGDYSAENFDDSAWAVGAMPFASSLGHPNIASQNYPDAQGTVWPLNSTIWARRQFILNSARDLVFEVFVDNYVTVWVNGVEVLPRSGTYYTPSGDAFHHQFTVPANIQNIGTNVIVLKAEDQGIYSYCAAKLISEGTVVCGISAMNPAHIIRHQLTQKMKLPDAMLSASSFTYAADVLFAEGFGLCEAFDADSETPEQFIQKICDIIGANCTQSRADGLIYLDLLRNDYNVATLPVFTDDDVLDWLDEVAVPAELANSVQIGWRDVLVDEGLDRVTAPVKALGHIRSSGREMPQVIDWRGIPFENIALRVAKRELDARSKPLRRVTASTLRKHVALRPGLPARLMMPKRGIADMVVRVGEMDIGSPADAKVSWVWLQDIFNLPETTALDTTDPSEPGAGPPGTPPGDPAAPIKASLAEEAPYVEVVAVLTEAQMAALGEESGYLITGVVEPDAGSRYAIYSKLPVETYTRRGFAEFCPSALALSFVSPDQTSVQFLETSLIDRVTVGSWALWDGEIVRVDAISSTIATFARGCGDTLPREHLRRSTVFFLGDAGGTDEREYVLGDNLNVKLPVTTGSVEEVLAGVQEHLVEFDQRLFRPYPPANVKVAGVSVFEAPPEEVVAVGKSGTFSGGYVGVPYSNIGYLGDPWRDIGSSKYRYVTGTFWPGATVSHRGRASIHEWHNEVGGIPLTAGTYAITARTETFDGFVDHTQNVTIAARPAFAVLDFSRRSYTSLVHTGQLPPFSKGESLVGSSVVDCAGWTSGKRYCEITITEGASFAGVTLGVHAASLDNLHVGPTNPNTVAYNSIAAGAGTYGLAYDTATGSFYLREPGGWAFGLSPAQTAAVFGPLTSVNGRFRFAATGSGIIKANFGNEPWVYAIPAGYEGVPMPVLSVPAMWDSQSLPIGTKNTVSYDAGQARSVFQVSTLSLGDWRVLATFGKSSGKWQIELVNPRQPQGEVVGVAVATYTRGQGLLGALGTDNSIGIHDTTPASQAIYIDTCFGGVHTRVSVPWVIADRGYVDVFSIGVNSDAGGAVIYANGSPIHTITGLPAGTYFAAASGGVGVGYSELVTRGFAYPIAGYGDCAT